MAIKGKRFRRATGRSTQSKRPSQGAKMLRQWNTLQPRKTSNVQAQMKAVQANMRPIKAGNIHRTSSPQSQHQMLVVDHGGGVYGYIRS